MKNTINALVSIGFSQEEAQSQIKELNDLILALVAKRVMEENPEAEQSEEGLKKTIEEKYTKEEYQKIFEEIAGTIVRGYFDAITKDLAPAKRDEFFAMVEEDFKQTT